MPPDLGEQQMPAVDQLGTARGRRRQLALASRKLAPSLPPADGSQAIATRRERLTPLQQRQQPAVEARLVNRYAIQLAEIRCPDTDFVQVPVGEDRAGARAVQF